MDRINIEIDDLQNISGFRAFIGVIVTTSTCKM